jgi:NAD(P)-dependent dehydrogenase (short-subunit alcohol dehydrogenase family)
MQLGEGCANCGKHLIEVVRHISYLAGPEAGFVTGASLTIDEGLIA